MPGWPILQWTVTPLQSVASRAEMEREFVKAKGRTALNASREHGVSALSQAHQCRSRTEPFMAALMEIGGSYAEHRD